MVTHPVFLMLGILEVIVVGLLLRRYNGRLFCSAAFYWFIIAIPLIIFISNAQYPNDNIDVKLIICIYVVNGLFNALFAEIIHQYMPLRRWSGLSNMKRLPSTINQLLLHLTLGIVMGAFLLNMLVNSLSSFKEASVYAEHTSTEAINTVSKEWSAISSSYAGPLDEVQTRQLQFLIDRYTFPDRYTFSLVDQNHLIVASNQSDLANKHIRPLEKVSLRHINNNLYFLTSNKNENPFKPYTWQDEKFLYKSELVDGSGFFLVSIPLSNYHTSLFDKYFIHFIYMLCFAIAAAIVAMLINRSIARSLQRLAVSTKNLSLKLSQNRTLELPKSSIIEIHSLIANFKHMGGSLLHLFHESQRNTDRLQAQAELLLQSEERLHQLAYYDMLTGLPNRLQFTLQFQELIKKSLGNTSDQLPIAVLFADINRFKQVNDTLGHSFGDRLLQMSANRFMNMNSEACSVYRLGGDEFVFVARYEDESELKKSAQAICDSFNEPFVINGFPLFLTISVGISVFPHDGEDMDKIIRNADIAMYNAKEEGDGCYRFFKPDQEQVIAEKMRLENGLYNALLEDQFSLQYQPKINASSGELSGIEALIRWNHPDFGLVPPDKFIPLAEESGFILEIDSWVFHEACRQNKAWQDAGLNKVCVSVNISARHFYQGNLKEMILTGLQKTGLEPKYVSLEITEGVFMRNIDQVIETILYLRNLGIQISIDDFGTGYSSLNQLQRLPITDVKLDRSFISGITSDDKKSSIVRAIIELVHSMNMKVVAEGIETIDESQFCRELNCDELQGYLFSRPLPASQMEALLAQHKKS
ncbi:hypothetical protein L3i20_v220600 [Paenibacillus sp. L3-i20]|nr:hypothetical protein L3i20_v220600 [Paenibacillus sp. L3-i20]